jgi:hypothetical protein
VALSETESDTSERTQRTSRTLKAHGLSLLESHAGEQESSRELDAEIPCGLTFWAGGRERDRKKVYPGIKN